MALNIHYKNIQEATKDTVRPLLEQKVSDVQKIFGEFKDDDQVISQITVEYFEKKDTFEIHAHMKVRKNGKESNLTAEAEHSDLMTCVDHMKNELQAQARKYKE